MGQTLVKQFPLPHTHTQPIYNESVTSTRTRAYLLLLIVSAIWGAAGPIIKYTLGYFDPITFLTYRFFLTSLVLIPIWFFVEPHHHLTTLSSKDWVIIILSGLLGSTGNLLPLFYGFSLTTSLDGTVISSSSPIITALAGIYFLRERVTRREQLGLLTAFLGSVIIVIQPFFKTGQIFTGSMAGNLLVLLSNFTWTAYVILTKKGLRDNLSPLFLTTSMFFLGFLSLIPLFIIHNSLFISPLPVSAHLGVIYMALISGALAYFLYQKGQKSIEASEANLFSYLSPLFAFPLAYFWLHEPLTVYMLSGSAIIALGVGIASWKPHPLNLHQ